MQQCPNCGEVYDESEYAKCPYCHPSDDDYDPDIDKEVEELLKRKNK